MQGEYFSGVEQVIIPFAQRLRSFFLRLMDFIFIGLGLLFLLALLPSRGGPTKAVKIAATEIQMHQIETAFLSYQAEYGTIPPARNQAELMKDLLGDNPRQITFLNLRARDQDAEGHVLDIWGTPFCLTILDSQHLQILSAGPDKIWQTPDDLHSN